MADFAAAASKHHTVWVSAPHEGTAAHRYVVVGDRLVMVDEPSAALPPTGTNVTASIHHIAAGPPVASRTAALETWSPDELDDTVLHALIGHRRLGSTPAQVTRALHRVRRSSSFAAIPVR